MYIISYIIYNKVDKKGGQKIRGSNVTPPLPPPPLTHAQAQDPPMTEKAAHSTYTTVFIHLLYI
jgi:hypothetical protein